MERNSTAKTAEVQARAETYLKKLRERTTKQAISDALSDAKVQLANSSAARDAASRANEVFSLNDQGDLVALEPDGTQMFNKDNKPLTPKDFVQRLIDEAPHLFSAGSGGGAPGSGGGGGGSRRPGVVQLSRTDAKGFGQLASKIADGTVTVEYID
jgi:hypothetical protein